MNDHSFYNKITIYQALIFSIILCSLVILYAAYSLRGLYADGAFYLLKQILNSGFFIGEPARKTVHLLQQWPTVLLLNIGIKDTIILSRIYGFTLLFTPLLLISLSYFFLPRPLKHLFLYPVFFYLASILASSFAAIGEAEIASAYFWPLFFLLLFYQSNVGKALLALLLSIGALWLHEAYVFIAPILLAISYYRLSRSSKNSDRLLFLTLIILFAGATIISAYYIIFPRDPANFSSFTSTVLRLKFLINIPYINMPALAGIIAGVILIVGFYLNHNNKKMLYGLIIIASFVSVITVASVFSYKVFTPSIQFEARSYGALLTPILAAIFLLSIGSGLLKKYFESTFCVAIIVALTVGQCGWHLVATHYWRSYITTFYDVLSNNKGLISYNLALSTYSPRVRVNFERMSWIWTNPTMSILLANQGNVKTIIANAPYNKWEPFDPKTLEDAILKSDYFNFSEYLRSIEERQN